MKRAAMTVFVYQSPDPGDRRAAEGFRRDMIRKLPRMLAWQTDAVEVVEMPRKGMRKLLACLENNTRRASHKILQRLDEAGNPFLRNEEGYRFAWIPMPEPNPFGFHLLCICRAEDSAWLIELIASGREVELEEAAAARVPPAMPN